MTSGDGRQHFIFHNDDDDGDPRPASARRSEVVVAGHQNDQIIYPSSNIHSFSAGETKLIRMRSACLNRITGNNPNLPVHIWPDKVRHIGISKLRYVVRNLPKTAPTAKGKNQPQLQRKDQLKALSETCSVLWFLECDISPFVDAAECILKKWKAEKRQAKEAETMWLAIIAFVLRHDDDLRVYLDTLVWHSSATSDCAIEHLQDWVNEKRGRNLELVYTFFQEQISQLRISHPNSGPVAKIYSDLTNSGVDFRYGWSTHRDKRWKVLGMSPQGLIDVVMDALRNGMRDEKVEAGNDANHKSMTNGFTRKSTSGTSGQRGGRGGAVFELIKSLMTSPHAEDIGTKAVRAVVDEAEKRRKNKWKEEDPERVNEAQEGEIDALIEWRNAQQKEWKSGFMISGEMSDNNGESSSAQSVLGDTAL